MKITLTQGKMMDAYNHMLETYNDGKYDSYEFTVAVTEAYKAIFEDRGLRRFVLDFYKNIDLDKNKVSLSVVEKLFLEDLVDVLWNNKRREFSKHTFAIDGSNRTLKGKDIELPKVVFKGKMTHKLQDYLDLVRTCGIDNTMYVIKFIYEIYFSKVKESK